MHSKDQSESQTESPENGNTEYYDERTYLPDDKFLERTKFKASADNTLNLK